MVSDAVGEDGDFGLSGLDCCAGIEAPDDGESVAPAIGFFAERKRRVKIDAAAGSENRGEVQGGRKNTDDGGGVIESERSANDIRIGGKAALPKSVA